MINLAHVVTSPMLAQPFSIYRTTGAFGEGGWIPTIGGQVQTAAVESAHKGIGYHVNDVLTLIQSVASGCNVKVLTIGTGGSIESVSILTAGQDYVSGAGLSVSVLPSGGSGVKIDITASILNPQVTPCHGEVSVINEAELDMLPEGNRIKGAQVFHLTKEVFTTRDGALSDQILWKGEMYRVINNWPYGSYGFYKVAAARMEGM
jgi:hypothetical protein